MANDLDFSKSPWNARAMPKDVSYVIGQSIDDYLLDRMDAQGRLVRLGTYTSLAEAQAAAQADANM